MNTANADALSRVAAQVDRAENMAGLARLAVDGMAHPDAQKAAKAAGIAEDACRNALQSLLTLGAARPGPAVARDTVPLQLLDTPATRRLLAVLEEAADAGAAVDRERGWIDADGSPVGFGETYANAAALVRVEVLGPQGLE